MTSCGPSFAGSISARTCAPSCANSGTTSERRSGTPAWTFAPGQARPADELDLPEGTAGIAVVRALAQWTLDYTADGNDEGFPFDLPYLDFYVRCLHAYWASAGFLRKVPADPKVTRHLVCLKKMLARMDCDVPPFAQMARDLNKRENLFRELRVALRLDAEPDRGKDAACAPGADARTPNECEEMRAAIDKLTVSLKERRPERGPAKDIRQAVDTILEHLERHAPYLWGHAITLESGHVRLVDRTNNILEGFFHGMKHGERRRSGRKILTQDFERLPPAAALALNLNRSDYVKIVCGTIEDLPQAFSKLDDGHRGNSLRARTPVVESPETETASMPLADKKLIRSEQMEKRTLAAIH